jgi:hypothetical protein
MAFRPPAAILRRRPQSGGARPRVRSTLDFAALHDHARLPARFFGRILAVGAVGYGG